MAKQASKVSWFELPADDIARAGKFYGKAFGWKTPDMGGGGVFALTTPADEQGNPTKIGGINGDISLRKKGLDQPLIHISVDNIEAQLREIEDAGGKIVYGPEDAREFGGPIWAVFSDTEGNHVGIYSYVAQ